MRLATALSFVSILALTQTKLLGDQVVGPRLSISDHSTSANWGDELRAAQAPAPAKKQEPAEAEKPAAEKPAPRPPVTDLAQTDQRSLETMQRRWLASAPNMFGDSFSRFDRVGVGSGFWSSEYSDIPGVGGSGRLKIGENNRAMPDDRVFLIYNHYNNALAAHDGYRPDTFSNDIYTLGIEKTLCSGLWSIETRLPLLAQADFRMSTAPGNEFGATSGHFGNISLVLKNLIWESNVTAIAAGLGINLPTGADVDANLFGTRITIENDALHLGPFLGMTNAPTERLFFQSFAQLDFAANSNSVTYVNNTYAVRGYAGEYTEQNVLFLDGTAGYWLYQNPCARCVTGLAGIVELHYATTLQDSDEVAATVYETPYLLGDPSNRKDVLNLTAGLHLQMGPCTSVRVAAVAPLRENSHPFLGATDRFFDSEIYMSVIRRF